MIDPQALTGKDTSFLGPQAPGLSSLFDRNKKFPKKGGAGGGAGGAGTKRKRSV